MYQNAGEKGIPHTDPEDPPRRRGNKARGHGTWDNDRPPVLGVIGRNSGRLCLAVCTSSATHVIEPLVLKWTKPGSTCYTDEWCAYKRLPDHNRNHKACCHTPGKREWARDADGDGIREVHCNTIEGIWVGLRNFLRPFRGISKRYLGNYVAIFQIIYNLENWVDGFLKALSVSIPKTT